MHPAWAATAVALVIVFLASYIAIRVLAAGLMRGVHNIRALGALDRVLGAGFGLVRGLVVLGVFYLAFNLAPPPTGTPAWIAQARLYPVARACADALRALAPRGLGAGRPHHAGARQRGSRRRPKAPIANNRDKPAMIVRPSGELTRRRANRGEQETFHRSG